MTTVNTVDINRYNVTVDPTAQDITVQLNTGAVVTTFISATAPAAATNGALWYNTTDSQLYIRQNDAWGETVTTATIEAAGAVMETDTSTAAMQFVVDEDNMASDSATKVPTQQSVKAYVDAEVPADTDDLSEGLTNLYYTDARANSAIDTRVTKSFVDLLNVDADTLDGNDSTAFATAAQGTLADSALQSSDIGVSIQGYTSVLQNTTASYTTAEETKLAGIETGATADQTGAEIKSLYEAELNTNAFTDAEKTKLAGIETGADVTDTANVTAAGAVMDSELTDETAVKAINQGLATTDSPSFVAVTTDVTGTVSSIANHDTGDLAEGSNLYYTDARARSAISLTSSNTNELSYNSTTGEFQYTSPSTLSETTAVTLEVRNTTGSTISKGTPVYISGHSGSKVLIAPADADDATKMPSIGLATSNINNNSDGTVTSFGTLVGVNTSAYSEGDTL